MINRRIGLVFLAVILFAAGLSAQNGSWNWAQSAGGSSDDKGVAMAMDSQGYLYVCGWFTGQASFGGTTLTASGSMDMYVAKLTSDGTWLWVKQAGATASCEPVAIAVDANNEVYVSGSFDGAANFGLYQLSTAGYTDVFVTKLSTDGEWLWALRGGGGNYDTVRDMDVAADGSIYLGGSFWGTATFGTDTFTSPNNASDIFVARLDPTGSWLWAKKAGGPQFDACNGITQSGQNIYITGYFNDTALFGDLHLTSLGNKDIYVAKLDASTGDWLNVWQAGSSDANSGTTVLADGSGNVYLSGSGGGVLNFGSISVFAPNAYIAKLGAQGDWLWALRVPGDGQTKFILRFDQYSNVVVAGSFSGVPNFGNVTLIPHAGMDILAAALSPEGNWLWAKAAGGNGDDSASGMVHATNGNTYICGTFTGSCEFDGFIINSAGMKDAFVARLSAPSSVDDNISPRVTEVRLGRMYPNPFTASSQLQVSADKDVDACELALYDLKGRKLQTLYQGHLQKGEHSFSLDSYMHSLDSGVYIVSLKTATQKQTSKLVKVK